MILNLPAFLRSMINKTRDEKNNLVFDTWELDDIVTSAIAK